MCVSSQRSAGISCGEMSFVFDLSNSALKKTTGFFPFFFFFLEEDVVQATKIRYIRSKMWEIKKWKEEGNECLLFAASRSLQPCGLLS